jgi:hypothetical protein
MYHQFPKNSISKQNIPKISLHEIEIDISQYDNQKEQIKFFGNGHLLTVTPPIRTPPTVPIPHHQSTHTLMAV